MNINDAPLRRSRPTALHVRCNTGIPLEGGWPQPPFGIETRAVAAPFEANTTVER